MSNYHIFKKKKKRNNLFFIYTLADNISTLCTNAIKDLCSFWR